MLPTTHFKPFDKACATKALGIAYGKQMSDCVKP